MALSEKRFRGKGNEFNNMLHLFYATGSAAMAESITPTLMDSKDYRIVEVSIHLDGAATQEDFTIQLDSALAATVYDQVLFKHDMSVDAEGTAGALTDLVWRPAVEDRPIIRGDDDCDFTWTNTDTATWGLQILVEEF